MTAYFIRRFLLVIPTFIGITMMVFIITRLVPGGPVERMIAEYHMRGMERSGAGMSSGGQNQPLSEEQIEELKRYYGFDKPIFISYLLWFKKVIRFDLGSSTRYYEPVWDIIKSKLPVSLFYGVIAIILTYSICIPLGILKAIKHKTTIDNTTSIIVFVGYAIPNYIIAIILLIIFSSWLDLFPLGGFTSDNFSELTLINKIWDVTYHAILPLIAYMAGSFAVMTFMMKNSLMDHLASDFIRTAIAKGIPFKRAVFTHATRNSLIPLATSFGNNLSLILMGSYLIEKIFNIDGMGLLSLESIIQRDYPVVLGTLVISSLLFLIGNILSDICVAIVDPRVKFE
jgi:microcin C transport system permease protein